MVFKFSVENECLFGFLKFSPYFQAIEEKSVWAFFHYVKHSTKKKENCRAGKATRNFVKFKISMIKSLRIRINKKNSAWLGNYK